MKINGNEELEKVLTKLGIDLVRLVAETSIWADPKVCRNLETETGSVVRYPKCRRGKKGETRGDKINGVMIDDNTYANYAVKRAAGFKKGDISDYEACHIWADTCYDERYHTAIPNLVLIPRAIAGLSDHLPSVIDALKFRSYELYEWVPRGESIPQRPQNYPNNWSKPKYNVNQESLKKCEMEILIDVEQAIYIDKVKSEIDKVQKRVPKWLANGRQINSIILTEFMRLVGKDKTQSVARTVLRDVCHSKGVTDFDGNFNQMSHYGSKNHGKVFEVEGDDVRLWEPVRDFIIKEWN